MVVDRHERGRPTLLVSGALWLGSRLTKKDHRPQSPLVRQMGKLNNEVLYFLLSAVIANLQRNVCKTQSEEKQTYLEE